MGFCIRNHLGMLVRSGSLVCRNNSIIMAEAFGLRAGVQELRRLGLPRVTIEGDNLCIINSIMWTIPWEIGTIIADVDEDLKMFDQVKVNHCFREANTTTNLLANKASLMTLLYRGILVSLSIRLRITFYRLILVFLIFVIKKI